MQYHAEHTFNEYPIANCTCYHCLGLLRIHNREAELLQGEPQMIHNLPPGGIGPFMVTSDKSFLVYTISGVFAFDNEDVATAFAARLISRGDELKVVIAKAVPIKSLTSKTDPDVLIQDLDAKKALNGGTS